MTYVNGHNIIMTVNIQYEGGAEPMIYLGIIYYDKNNVNIYDGEDFIMESAGHRSKGADILMTLLQPVMYLGERLHCEQGKEHHHIVVSVHLELWKITVMSPSRVHGQDSA